MVPAHGYCNFLCDGMAEAPRISHGSRLKRAMVLGCLLFGMDLILFNFFMPLVFAANIPDQ